MRFVLFSLWTVNSVFKTDTLHFTTSSLYISNLPLTKNIYYCVNLSEFLKSAYLNNLIFPFNLFYETLRDTQFYIYIKSFSECTFENIHWQANQEVAEILLVKKRFHWINYIFNFNKQLLKYTIHPPTVLGKHFYFIDNSRVLINFQLGVEIKKSKCQKVETKKSKCQNIVWNKKNFTN